MAGNSLLCTKFLEFSRPSFPNQNSPSGTICLTWEMAEPKKTAGRRCLLPGALSQQSNAGIGPAHATWEGSFDLNEKAISFGGTRWLRFGLCHGAVRPNQEQGVGISLVFARRTTFYLGLLLPWVLTAQSHTGRDKEKDWANPCDSPSVGREEAEMLVLAETRTYRHSYFTQSW